MLTSKEDKVYNTCLVVNPEGGIVADSSVAVAEGFFLRMS